MRKLRIIKKHSLQQEQLLYPLLFQDDFYGFAYNRSKNELPSIGDKIHRLSNQINFLTLKRFIKKSRQANFSWMVYDQFLKKFQITQEILIIIFESIFATQSESFVKKMNEWNKNQSIHSIFPFIEDNIVNFTSCLYITIPYSFHPEILIRLFRRYIIDISFLHFIRLLLHRNYIISCNLNFSYWKNKKFYNLLWNFYNQNFEDSLIYIWKRFYDFQSIPFWFLIDQINFVKKIKNLPKGPNFPLIEKVTIRKNKSIHYMKSCNNLILTTGENSELLIKNWNTFSIFFFEKYLNFWFEPYRFFVKNLSKEPICFLGYIFYTESKSNIIQIELSNEAIKTNSVIKEFWAIIPNVPLIRLLAQKNFCDTLGRPICKLSWTTLADNEIFTRFNQISRKLCYYYSGCAKKKTLYQLQYILRFSCAKTLACKHKSTIRTVWKKYGSKFIQNSVFLKKRYLNKLWEIQFHAEKFWYLDITQINYLANLCKRLKNVQDSYR
uniref:Maturase K n=1 Tax=Radula japonica TaxID=1068553 RepID=A0A4Y5P632_9MARC|nr:maturase K [Radula japonica]QCW58728.1 maturase K [Radula japonica]